jgi:hypothetical protein
MSQSVAVASPVEDGKRGELVGGALTEEALDSSRSVLGATRGGAQRGLQQFFTPREAAELVKQVLDPFGRLPVLDPTAGNGALLEPWRRARRFGIEIDRDQIRAGDYESIGGDLQRAYPMLLKLGVQFPRVVVNPPFGLTWADGAGKPENTTVGAWRMSLGLLEPGGVGAFICGRDRFRREILQRDDATGVFATVECEDLFEGVALPVLIAFFVRPLDRDENSEGVLLAQESSREGLTDRELPRQLSDAMREASTIITNFSAREGGPLSEWKLVDRELQRRRREQESERPTTSNCAPGSAWRSARRRSCARRSRRRDD